jgi:hypothetical protein
VGKRSRAERKKHQMQRALERADLGVLRALALRNPESGAAAIARAVEAGQLDARGDEVQALVAETSARLRTAGSFAAALRLSAAGGRASAATRLEEALAAFGCGDDARLKAMARDHEDVGRIAAPLVAAASGRRVPNTPVWASPLLRGVFAICRGAASAGRGSATAARTALAKVPEPVRGRLFVTEVAMAAGLTGGRGRSRNLAGTARALMRSSLVKDSARARAALAMALARRSPRAFLEGLGADLNLGKEAMMPALLHASCAVAGADECGAAVSGIVARLGAEAFPSSERAAASLHEGFALALSDPSRAHAAFDRAIALGADLVEALRGKMIADSARRDGPLGLGRPGSGKEFGASAARLARALASGRSAAPLVVVAAVHAAIAFATEGRHGKAGEMLELARSVAGSNGSRHAALQCEVDLAEGTVVLESDPGRALELAERVLAVRPSQHEAWHVKERALRERGDEAAADDVVLAAAERSVCEHFGEAARAIRRKRGVRLTLVPGKVRAGELAAELRARLAAGQTLAFSAQAPLPFEDVEACRAALAPDARAAFDAATLHVLWQLGEQQAAGTVLRARALDGGLGTRLVRDLVGAAVDFGLRDPVCDVVQELVSRDGAATLANAAMDAAFATGDRGFADRVVLSVATRLSRTGTLQFKERLRAWNRRWVPDDAFEPGDAVDRFERLLEPDFSLHDHDDEDDGEPEESEGPSFGSSRLPRDALVGAIKMTLDVLGMPHDAFDSLTPSDKEQVISDFVQAQAPPSGSAESEAAVRRLLSKLGIRLEDVGKVLGSGGVP